jgi:benzoyl-CoA reductase/2-hydroxyglutaryl-CoA dehydratase subunit BcrC/BadD/HgdB
LKKIGFTTTVPVEIILSAGHIPVDLNNIFITSKNPYKFIDKAEEDGLPRNTCSWIKGIYTAVMQKNVDEVIAVTEGDCSNTHALIELFRAEGIKVHTFAYPYGIKDKYPVMKNEIINLCDSVGTSLEKTIEYSKVTDKVREKLRKIDKLTIEEKVSGFENHLFLVSSTDFNSDLEMFSNEINKFLEQAEKKSSKKSDIRLGFIGVPPIFTDIYQFIEEKNAAVVFNEIQRQFSIPSISEDYVQRYIDYTYPYDIFYRLQDIKKEIKLRELDGIIHYVQSFCYRQIQDVVIKREIDIPVITIEGNDPGPIDARTKIRIESFIEMLESKKC